MQFLHSAPLALVPLLFLPLQANAQIEFENVAGDHVAITIDGQPFSNFFYGPTHSKPFLPPLRTASGLVVTRRWPVEAVETDSHDHPHHRGLWIGFGDVNGVNFWETEPESIPSGDNPKVKGKVTLAAVGDIKPGKKSGSISMTFHWDSPDKGTSFIEEERVLTFGAGKELRIIDVDLDLHRKDRLEVWRYEGGLLRDSRGGWDGGQERRPDDQFGRRANGKECLGQARAMGRLRRRPWRDKRWGL